MKKKAVYKRKLTRALRSSFTEHDSLQSYTVDEACQRLYQISFKKGKNA